MEKDANYFRVGVFVSISLLALVAFVIWLVGSHGFNHYDHYTIYFTDPVSGLSEDGPVKYKGVDVGKVIAIRLTPDQSTLVKVDIEVQPKTPVRAETTVTMAMQGITGQDYIELATPSLDGKPVPQMPGERYPVLKGNGSQFAKFLDDMPGLSKQLMNALGAIDDFAHSGEKTAESIRAFTDELKQNPSEILRGPAHKGVEIPK